MKKWSEAGAKRIRSQIALLWEISLYVGDRKSGRGKGAWGWRKDAASIDSLSCRNTTVCSVLPLSSESTYIEFLIRFSIEWHFINLFYLSSFCVSVFVCPFRVSHSRPLHLCLPVWLMLMVMMQCILRLLRLLFQLVFSRIVNPSPFLYALRPY